MNEQVDDVALRETFDEFLLVNGNSRRKITCHTNIQGSIPLARQNVNGWPHNTHAAAPHFRHPRPSAP